MYVCIVFESKQSPFCTNSSPISTIPFLSQLYMLFSSFSKNPLSRFSDSFICMGVSLSSHDCILKKKKKNPTFPFLATINSSERVELHEPFPQPYSYLAGFILCMQYQPLFIFVCNCTVVSSNYCFAADIHFLWSLRSLHLLFCDDHLA